MNPITASMGWFARVGAPLWRPIDERLNPILVKEVRQALRGKYFSIVFWLMLTIATVIGALFLVSEGMRPSVDGGVKFFLAMYGCLSVAVHVFVPFSVFLSVGSEWEENTYDLLVLSDLRPRHIVWGKLLSAVVQMLLFYTAFGPFLVFAFLLRGLDLTGAAWILGLTVITSTGLSCLALCLSSLVRHRFARMILMALQAVILVFACGLSITFSFALFEERFIHIPEFRLAAAFFATAFLMVAAFAFAIAATRFTHPEENRSSSVRVLTSVVVLAGVAWTSYLYSWRPGSEILWSLSITLMIGLTVISIIFCTEPESLGRRVRLQVPKSPLTALLVAPYLPGGSRGVLFYWLNMLPIVAQLAILPRLIPPRRPMDDLAIAFGLLAYLAAYLLFPTVLFARRHDQARWRNIARILVPIFAAMSFVVPTVVFFLFGSRVRADHIGNPVWTIEEWMRKDSMLPLMSVAVIALIACTLNLPRIGRGFLELGRCRSERVKREAAGAPGAVSSADDGGSSAATGA